jgi:ketosteroid isomerase-like protein
MMKKIFICCCFTFCLAALTFGQKAEEDAIRAIIDAENLAYTTKPVQEVWSNYWLLDDHTRLFLQPLNQPAVSKDKKGLLAMSNQVIGDKRAQIQTSNIKYSITGNVAIVTADYTLSIPEEKQSLVSAHLYLLKKIDGKWLINCATKMQSIVNQ